VYQNNKEGTDLESVSAYPIYPCAPPPPSLLADEEEMELCVCEQNKVFSCILYLTSNERYLCEVKSVWFLRYKYKVLSLAETTICD
jgi:hypothetical protein